MSSRKDDDNLLRMTKDDLQRWIQAEVDRNPHLMQRREQLARVEDWVKQKEREATYTRLLYSNACESVLECESVMKGLYGMLGQEYRDEDSEEEGEGGGEPQDIIHITDDEEDKQENSVLNGDDDDIVVIDLGATKETLEPMLEKVTVAIQKSSRLVQDLVQMVNKTSSMNAASPSSSSDVSNRPSSASTPETRRSESVTPKLEIPENPIAIVKTESLPKECEMSSLLSSSEQDKPIAGYKSDSKPTIKTEPQLTAITPWEMSVSKQHETSATLNSPFLKLIKAEPQLTAVSPSETPETFSSPRLGSIAEIKTESQLTVIKSEMASPPSTSKPFTFASIPSIKTEPQLRALTSEMSLLERDSEKSSSLCSDHKATSNTKLTLLAMTSPEILKTSACPNSASVASKETDPSEMSSPSSSLEQMEIAASEQTANIETNHDEPESTTETPPEYASLLNNPEEPEPHASHDSDSTDETEQPKTRSKSSPTTRLRSSKISTPVSSTFSPQTETTRAQSPADSNDDPSDTEDSDFEPPASQSESFVDNTDDESSSDASAEPSSPAGSSKSSSESSKQQGQKEIKLKVGNAVLGKRAHNLWSKGTVQDVQTEEGGRRYKVEFKSGKEMVLPAYHVASLQPPILKDLFIGCRVVASSKDDEGKASFNAGVLVELPERKNRMRFLVFFDDGHAAYLALPELHLVCKQLKKVWKDIEDEKFQLQVKEYLRVYPNPIAVVLRVGQDTRAIRDGEFESCTVLQLDGSLIQICFKENERQWGYLMGPSQHFYHFDKEWIYKGSDKLEHIVNIKQLHAQLCCLAGNATPQLNTAPSSTAVPSATVTSATVTSKAVSPVQVTVTRTSSISPQKIMSAAFQPKVILERLTMLSPVLRTFSNLRSAKRPAPDEEEECFSMQHQNKSIYLHHRCCPACLDGVRPSQGDMHRGQNPLLIPLLFKFRRMTARRRIDGKVFFHIFYRSPCGRSLCDMQEVQEYLLETRCDFLFLEMFCMDPFVLVNRARPPSTSTGKPHLYLPDISEGREVLPVPCINEVDNTLAPNISYTKDRVPAPGFSINTSPDFLIGCDCTDGCQDRSKCACHQLTIEATSLCSGGPVDVSAGYTHKRLPTTLPTGVYECNPLCRCDPRMCSNRLVQHGLQLRLELFMTQHKGWGIRCRDDVAKGTFVCVFTGKIVNEDRVNEDDTVSGNEYLANLDFIEGVEKLKEGYESEAYCSDTEVETNKKTITMKTGPLWKNTLYREDSSSGEELMELDTEREETEVNHMFLDERKLSHKPHETYKDAQKKVIKQMRGDGEETSGPKRCFAIKSFQRRVKPPETLDAKNEKTRTAVTGRNTRRLFNGEETCYIIDARQEGNLGRFINHSCSPNLFVQNVFVDTHDLRFPWVAFFASKRIKAGTELTWDYNYEVGSVEGKVLLCCCGSLRCTGRLL
uniref:[histone H3]-lysine(4) N-trimethyltransferase n=1 Tax=Cyprinus carpio TaxID=7962 RepID=A0A8C1GHX9_CYPCA